MALGRERYEMRARTRKTASSAAPMRWSSDGTVGDVS